LYLFASAGSDRMKILHVFRAPIGGLFRHVRDLARGQSELGHHVGILCDSTTGADYADRLLRETERYCALGIVRKPISRLPGLGDLAGARAVMAVAEEMQPDVLHGHGAKGGAYARLAGYRMGKRSFYTPHGGSLHYKDGNFAMTLAIAATERFLRRIGTGLTFVCAYERDKFDAAFGIKGKPHAVIHNGVWKDEFVPTVHSANARDFVFVGEMRSYKGVDILLRALALLPEGTATLVGDGPEMDDYKALARELQLSERVHFAGRMPMAEAVKLGRIMVLPSRFESFPYVVLETAAAGLPLITSAVGGIPEVVPKSMLCDPLTPDELAGRMNQLRSDPSRIAAEGQAYATHILKTCMALNMAERITEFYTTA
jgi:glycosyltransferase involved in cell wall biosynthesis